MEELFTDVIGAGAGKKQAAGGELFDRCFIHVFVGAKSAVDGPFLLGKSGGIENDEIVIERLFCDKVNGVFKEKAVFF